MLHYLARMDMQLKKLTKLISDLLDLSRIQNRATVSVQDFGIGIAKAHHQKIFGRFYQAEDAIEQTYPGLGIGLYICLSKRRQTS